MFVRWAPRTQERVGFMQEIPMKQLLRSSFVALVLSQKKACKNNTSNLNTLEPDLLTNLNYILEFSWHHFQVQND